MGLDRARETAPGELGFAPNNHHYTDVTSRLIAARVFQVVHAAGGSRGEPLTWQPPTQGETFIILKADVTKAHRRIKVLQKDWKYQVACIQNRWWVNRVGTYGMASAQLYWGRKASLVLRLLYYIFPQVDWHLVFVDDYCWVLRCSRADWVGGISDHKTKDQEVHLSQNGGPSGYLLRVKTSDHLRLTL